MNRLIKCDDSHRERLLEYLKAEAVRNTFIIGDILNYGFANDIQQVWMDEESQECVAVYLWFCNNLLIYSHRDTLNQESLSQVLEMKKLDQVMAKRMHLQQISDKLEGYKIQGKSLLGYDKNYKSGELGEDKYTYRVGTMDDIDCIYDFLQSGELAPLYRSREMIEKRIETGEGVHLLIEDGGKLVAHINSAASTPYSTMIGGLFTKMEYRSQGLGSFLVEKICERIVSEGRIPCLISAQPPENNLLYRLGFGEVEEFTTLEPM